VRISPDGLAAQFVPDPALLPQTTYSVAVSQGVRDLDSEALANALNTTFTTIPLIPVGEVVFTLLADRQIYRATLDGTSRVRLTETGDNRRPAWSPDGRRIAFARNTPGPSNGGRGTTDIYIMDADGSNPVGRTVGADFQSAAWSPDGRTLALSDEGLYDASIYLVSVENDGSLPRLFAISARSPAWSPDGERVAYVQTSGDDGYDQVHVVSVDGTGSRALAAHDGGGIYGLAWSPNGQQLAYSRCLDGTCALYVMDADGGHTRRITHTGNVQGATWSPDGMWIAFTLSSSGERWQPSVAYVLATGGTPRIVAPGGFNPSWRP
jgi:Tol biopolymer transport system component